MLKVVDLNVRWLAAVFSPLVYAHLILFQEIIFHADSFKASFNRVQRLLYTIVFEVYPSKCAIFFYLFFITL